MMEQNFLDRNVYANRITTTIQLINHALNALRNVHRALKHRRAPRALILMRVYHSLLRFACAIVITTYAIRLKRVSCVISHAKNAVDLMRTSARLATRTPHSTPSHLFALVILATSKIR
jgi:hypothetical protein